MMTDAERAEIVATWSAMGPQHRPFMLALIHMMPFIVPADMDAFVAMAWRGYVQQARDRLADLEAIGAPPLRNT